MSRLRPLKRVDTSAVTIRLAVMPHDRFPLSVRSFEEGRREPGADVSRQTVRSWWRRFDPTFAFETRKRGIEGMNSSRRRWQADEIFVKTN